MTTSGDPTDKTSGVVIPLFKTSGEKAFHWRPLRDWPAHVEGDAWSVSGVPNRELLDEWFDLSDELQWNLFKAQSLAEDQRIKAYRTEESIEVIHRFEILSTCIVGKLFRFLPGLTYDDFLSLCLVLREAYVNLPAPPNWETIDRMCRKIDLLFIAFEGAMRGPNDSEKGLVSSYGRSCCIQPSREAPKYFPLRLLSFTEFHWLAPVKHGPPPQLMLEGWIKSDNYYNLLIIEQGAPPQLMLAGPSHSPSRPDFVTEAEPVAGQAFFLRPPLILGGPTDDPLVRGNRKKRLTPGQYRVVKALWDAHPDRLSIDALARRADVEGPVQIIDRLRRDDDWRAVLDKPGRPHGGYGLNL